jgi:two-component system nitrogen regulation sensor histidine kinase NtrY
VSARQENDLEIDAAAEIARPSRRPRRVPTSPSRLALFKIVFTLVSSGLVFFAAYYLARQYPAVQSARSFANSLTFVLLINLNIIAVMVLGFLVIRNLVKLFLDRRRNILGARLQTRLVFSFVGLSLIPTCLLFFVAKGILETILSEWLSPAIESSIDGAVEVAKLHYDSEEDRLTRVTASLAGALSRVGDQSILPYLGVEQESVPTGPSPQLRAVVEHVIAEDLNESGYAEARIVDRLGNSILTVFNSSAPRPPPLPPALARLNMPVGTSPVVRPEYASKTELMRGYAPVKLARSAIALPDESSSGNQYIPTFGAGNSSDSLVLVVTQVISGELSGRLADIVRSYDDHKELKSYQRPIASSYLLTLIMVTLMIVFVAAWVGFHLARSMSVPIQLLAAATEQVAHGNLEFQIPDVGDDELSVLVRSFNTMTADLSAYQGELVSRRRYMETVLDNVGVGVFSIDNQGIVTTLNVAAAEILEIGQEPRPMRPLDQVLPSELTRRIKEMLDELELSKERVRSETCTFSTGRGTKHLQVTATRLIDLQLAPIGAVVLIDNLTELVRAQRMAAWREVARRIAHEIKNPLTPIQLNAQRRQRRFARTETGESGLSEAEHRMVDESTTMIVQQVETLRNLVNEFSQFARMPRSTLELIDLNSIIEQTASFYRSAHQLVTIEAVFDTELPRLNLDREQINRVLINLLDNALASIEQKRQTENQLLGKITISTQFDSELRIATLIVADNGLGIPDTDKPRLFEPYFSRRQGGTGLGLAIVSSIISDHHGFIRVRDNLPHGAMIIIEFPAGGSDASA